MDKINKTRSAKKTDKNKELDHNTSTREFYRKLLIMQEEERRRISRDLHDETGQMVIALGASLNVIEKELRKDNIEKAFEVIDENRKLIQEIAQKMKTMALNLRPPALDILGLSAVLREFFSQCTKSNPVKIKFTENTKGAKLNDNIEITLYRIVQEAIYNILKHANADEIKVNLIYEDKKLLLLIEDNGKGFDLAGYLNQFDPTKTGLRGIKERLDILGGSFSIDSAQGSGTKLKIFLSPVDKDSFL
ncbi:MAG: sensor histidine kinase [Candidatus Omnitrophica bacterium]|nr:sensor histidine kinase [Candidatus Omnitrophota bacterium]